MVRFHAAYKYENGEVQGFIGYGFTPDAAEADCVRQIRSHTCLFDPNQVIREASRLTASQRKRVLTDWKDILKAKRLAGHSVI